MNPAEKIAATYLRLNGFLLLPQFTAFGGDQHNHVDLLGLRAANSVELVGMYPPLPTDDSLFGAIPNNVCAHPRQEFLGAVAEVKTNARRDKPEAGHIAYVSAFLGGVPIVPMSFSESRDAPTWREDHLAVGNRHALGWVISRFQWMNGNFQGFTKSGSWPWSEDALAELLVLYKYGALVDPR